jgi:MFS family permease
VSRTLRLGLGPNLVQFALLVVVNAFVGAMVGLERTILPALAEQEFHLAARAGVLSFIAVFGCVKAATNYFAGRLADRFGRKPVLVIGWVLAAPVPFLLMWAPSWAWVLVANALLGASQGLTWSATVIMKIDLAGPERRGLAMGLNESAGYLAVGASALATGYVAATYGLRPQPFYLGVAFVIAGLLLSAVLVRETHDHARREVKEGERPGLTPREVFVRTSFSDRDLSALSQAGLVNNLNDGMAWGLFPLLFAARGLRIDQIGELAALYPAVWGLSQLPSGGLSDRIGRKWLIASGLWLQGGAIAVVALSSDFPGFVLGAVLLGLGTAMVYPTLLAAVSDVAHPSWRASAVGVYRLWRDLGYAFGALFAGIAADWFGVRPAVGLVAAVTAVSGFLVAWRLRETLRMATDPSCIEPEDLRLRLQAGENVVAVDVRSPEEFARGHVEGALNLPLQTLASFDLPLDPAVAVVTICGSGGGRSESAAQLLRGRGFKDVRSLCGGTEAWGRIAGATASGDVSGSDSPNRPNTR